MRAEGDTVTLTYRARCLTAACGWEVVGPQAVDNQASKHTRTTGHGTLTTAALTPTDNTTTEGHRP